MLNEFTKDIFLVTVYSCHVTYAFQSESTIYSCLNVKNFLSPRRCQISRLSNCNWTCTQNHLVLKRTLNHSVCPNSCVFLYELSGSGFESTCIHSALTFWHASSKEFLDIEATRECGFTLKTRTWHYKNMQSNAPYR